MAYMRLGTSLLDWATEEKRNEWKQLGIRGKDLYQRETKGLASDDELREIYGRYAAVMNDIEAHISKVLAYGCQVGF